MFNARNRFIRLSTCFMLTSTLLPNSRCISTVQAILSHLNYEINTNNHAVTSFLLLQPRPHKHFMTSTWTFSQLNHACNWKFERWDRNFVLIISQITTVIPQARKRKNNLQNWWAISCLALTVFNSFFLTRWAYFYSYKEMYYGSWEPPFRWNYQGIWLLT